MGLVLSHPWRTRWRTPSTPARIRVHVSLAVFTLAFLVLHIVVLATDSYAKVGWWGALLPMASGYRPVAVTLGVIAAYGGLLAGLTAAFAGRWARAGVVAGAQGGRAEPGRHLVARCLRRRRHGGPDLDVRADRGRPGVPWRRRGTWRRYAGRARVAGVDPPGDRQPGLSG